jgi:PAS domain S-box-containing protein
MFITDHNGTIEYVNSTFERITGYTAAEAVGETPSILKSGAQDESFYTDLWETITAGEIWESELTNKTKGGQRYRVKLTIVPITDDRGEITHFAAIEDDITDKQLRNQTLDVLNRVLRHNLRTAINVIDAHAELLEEELPGAEAKTALTAIRRQTESMKKIDDRAATIRHIWDRKGPSHVWGVPAIRAVVDRLREEYPDANIGLQVEITESVSLPDADLFEIAFQEAVENAIVHAEAETPTVEITVSRGTGGDEVVVSVADDGPGIPESERAIIETKRETPLTHGSGIGLWIMEWVTTSLGGRLELQETDSGATVAFHLPTVEGGDGTSGASNAGTSSR